MKIAIIGPSGLPVPAVKGGAIETLIDVIINENEKKSKLDIDIYTIYDKEAIEASKKYKNTNFIFLSKNIKLVKFKNKFISLLRKVFKLDIPYSYAKELSRYLKDSKYDKVIVEGDASLVAYIKKYIEKDKIYFHIHHNPLSTNHDEFRTLIKSCGKIITVSNFIQNALKQCMGDVSIQTKTLKNCTDVNKFNKSLYKRDCIRSKFNINSDDIVIMFVGRPIKEKGIKELLLAFKLLNEKYNNIKLLIVGNSGFGKEIKTEFDEELLKISSSIENKVIFTGFIHNSRIPQIHSAGDIMVVPSIYEDPAPLVVIESMASGLPIITTNSGGIPEYAGKDNCIIVKRNNIVKNLAKELEFLIENNEYREILSKKAQLHAQQYSNEAYYRDFIEILNG